MEPPCLAKEMSRLSLTGREEASTPAPVSVARPASRLTGLPEELIVMICKQIVATPEAFVCLSQTCRKLRRISDGVEFKDHHKWQVASLQANWSSYWTARFPSATDPRPTWLLPSWLTRGPDDANKSKLGDLLRRDLFCAGCRSPSSPRRGVRLPPFLCNSELCQKRPCGHCPGNPEHPGWQFLADGTCLRTAALIRTCPHRTVSAQEAWNTPPSESIYDSHCEGSPQQTSCEECDGKTRIMVPGLWDAGPSLSYLGITTDWHLTLDKEEQDSPLIAAEPGRLDDGCQLAARLVDRFRLHKRLYICPHHPIDGDRARCIAQLAPLVQGLLARIARADQRGLLEHQIWVAHYVKCAYCNAKVGLGGWPHPLPGPLVGATKAPAVPGPGPAWIVNHFHRQPTVALASLLEAVELPRDYPHARHPRLRHLTWCEDAACATNRRAAHLPVMLSRVTEETIARQQYTTSFCRGS
ncbi:hypothetical protein PG991_013973 [Apiospora marii]|uniref:F-box domain-containing protein n=1 Tax=Apiospora marii TaxID=335849 RepID=A0ABR1R7J3_9PEZI